MRFPAIFLTLLLAMTGQVRAQTYTWTGATSGNWNTATNWVGGIPLSGATTIIELDNTTNTTTNNNIPTTPFQLNQLIMQVNATSGFIINGGPLQFTGSGALIETNAGAYLNINAAIHFSVNTTLNPVANNVSGGEIRLGGVLTAASGTTVTVGTGTSTLGGIILIDNTNKSFHGTWSVTNLQVTQTSARDALSRQANVVTTGAQSSYVVGRTTASGFSDTGTILQLSHISGTGAFGVGTTISPSTLVVGFGGVPFALTGTGTLSGVNTGSHFGKVGNVTFDHSGGQAQLNATFSVRDGLFRITGNTAAAGAFGTASTGPLVLYDDAELRMVLSGTGSNGRIGNNQPVVLLGGIFRMDGSGFGASSTGFSEVLGALNIGNGQGIIRINTSTVRGSRLSFTNLNVPASPVGTLFVQSDNLGTDVLNTAGTGNINFVTAPTSQLVGTSTTYGATTTNLAILPYGFAATSSSGVPETFMTYDGSSIASLRGLVNTNFANTFAVPTNNVSLSAATILGASAITNALRLTAGSSVDLGGFTLTVTSGAILNNGGGNITNGTVQFGPTGNLTAFLTNNLAWLIQANLQALHFSKNGLGNLTFSGTATLGTGGIVAVNAGTLTLTPTTSFINLGIYQVSRGSTLDVTAIPAGLTLGTGQTLQGAGTVDGNVTVSASGTIRPSALGGTGTNNPSPGTLTVGNTKFNPNGVYEWYINSVLGGPYSQSLLQGSAGATLDLSALSVTNKFTIKITTLTLANATGAVYDNDAGADYTWPIANFPGGVTGITVFDPNDLFTIDTTGNTWGAAAPTLYVNADANNLYLTTIPIPEPGAVLASSALALAVARRFRRNRGKVNAA